LGRGQDDALVDEDGGRLRTGRRSACGAVPAALFIGVVMMLLGHVVGGLALFGASILAAGAAVVIASLSGMRHLRKLVGRQGYRVVRLGRGEDSNDRTWL